MANPVIWGAPHVRGRDGQFLFCGQAGRYFSGLFCGLFARICVSQGWRRGGVSGVRPSRSRPCTGRPARPQFSGRSTSVPGQRSAHSCAALWA